MAGLLSLIFGAVLGGSAISAARENARLMSKPYKHLEDGTPVYMDRHCNEYINGEKVVIKYNYDLNRTQKVGERTGKVYFDEEVAKRKHLESLDNIRKENEQSRGKLAYMKYDPVRKKQITCEMSTGKYICELVGEKDGTYRKYYLDPRQDSAYVCMRYDENDPGVKITREEFDRLNIFAGSHSAIDYSRDPNTYYRHAGSTRW